MKETFKQHPLYGSYMIGDKGTVNGIRRNNVGTVRPDGYKYVWIIDKGWQYVHRLVYETFVGDIPKGLEINHKDGNRSNNNVDNLEVLTHRENIEHSYKVLKRQAIKGVKHWNHGKSLSDATKTKMSDAKKGVKHPKFKGWYVIRGVRYASAKEAEISTGINAQTVRRRCKSNKNGFSFEPL